MSDSVTGQLGQAEPRQSLRAAIRTQAKQVLSWITARDAYDLASACALAALLVIVVCTFQDYAVSNDEGVQNRYGELIVAYYKSGFADRSLFNFDNLYLYGGLFDVTAVLLSHVLPIDIYELRHLLCALIGIGGIVAAGSTARLIAGPRAGFFAIIALAVCGSWYGGMFNHTKGVPLATFMAGATYFLIRTTRELPIPRMHHVIGLGVMTGAALGIKSLSLLLLGYAGLAILINTPRPIAGYWKERAQFILMSTLWFLPGLVAAYLIMIATWPYAALAPLNPIRGLMSFGDFHYHIRTIIFGRMYEMADVPRYYIPTYIAIRLPLLTLGAAAITAMLIALSVLASDKIDNRKRRREISLVAFTAFFPVVCQVITQGPALDGCRHFLFVFPPIAVLAGIGLSDGIALLKRWHRNAMIGGLALIAASYAWTTTKLIELHPHEYLYYNQLVGGLEGASRQFVTDYWVNIMPEAVEELHDFLDRTVPANARTHDYRVAVCGERVSYEQYARPNLHWIKMPDWRFADFYIAPTHMNCDRNLDGTTIATIERMGVTIGVVKDRRAIRAHGYKSTE